MSHTDLTGLTIRSAIPSDFEELSSMCERRLGAGYLLREDFDNRIRYPELFQVADFHGRPVAAVTMTPEGADTLSSAVGQPEADLLEAAHGKPLIHFRTAICAEDFEHRGLTQYLLSLVIENARKLGYGVILSPNWKYEGKVPAARMHEELGFENLGERYDLWADQEGYTCLYCKGPCHCTAVLYQLVL